MDAKSVGAVAAGYNRDDWVQIKADGDALLQALADAKRDDVEPGWRSSSTTSSSKASMASPNRS